MKNLVRTLFDKYCDWIDHWTQGHFAFFLQVVLLFGLPAVFCFLAFKRGNRSVCLQMLAFVFGILLACTIHVEKIVIPNPVIKAWILTICIAVLAFLPGFLPTLLTPTLGKQRKLRMGLWVLLAGLLLANLLMRKEP
jgi:hypothetical protein